MSLKSVIQPETPPKDLTTTLSFHSCSLWVPHDQYEWRMSSSRFNIIPLKSQNYSCWASPSGSWLTSFAIWASLASSLGSARSGAWLFAAAACPAIRWPALLNGFLLVLTTPLTFWNLFILKSFLFSSMGFLFRSLSLMLVISLLRMVALVVPAWRVGLKPLTLFEENP